MSLLEGLAVAGVVLMATAYLARRMLRTLLGRSCGCGSASDSGCPAAGSLASDLERLAREADARG